MTSRLPPKTRQLLHHYLHLKIGPHTITCPYYQNLTKSFRHPVFAAKGTPVEIEAATIHFLKKTHKDPNSLDPNSLRYLMVMAGIGIDCSGLVANLINSLLKETGLGNITTGLKPHPPSFIKTIKQMLRSRSQISADSLTSTTNSLPVNDLQQIEPADLIRFGKEHVAIITQVQKLGNLTSRITYCHSTYDYLNKYGVRLGTITIKNPQLLLENQVWQEVYQGKNWTKADYLNSPPSDRGIRRLNALIHINF